MVVRPRASGGGFTIVAILLIVLGIAVYAGAIDLSSIQDAVAPKEKKVVQCSVSIKAVDEDTQSCFNKVRAGATFVGAVTGCFGAASRPGTANAIKTASELATGATKVALSKWAFPASCLAGGVIGGTTGYLVGGRFAAYLACPVNPRVVEESTSCHYTGQSARFCPKDQQFAITSVPTAISIVTPSGDQVQRTSILPRNLNAIAVPADIDKYYGFGTYPITFCTNDDVIKVRLVDRESGKSYNGDGQRVIIK